MKKISIIISTILSFGNIAFSQETITRANFVPNIGESQLFYVADTNSIIDNTVGANVVFDYSQLRTYGQTQTQYFIDPTTTVNTTDYPTATFTDTTGGFAGNLKYNQDFTDSLNTIGLILDINSFGRVIAKFDADPEIIMKFPFNYGDTFTDNYGGEFTSVAAPLPTNGNGSITVSADAWGKLKLPMSLEIDSVLRISRIENLLTDTIFLQPFLPNILPINVSAEQISYYKPSISKHPLLSFITTYINGDTINTIVSQYPMFGVGINSLNSNINLNIYPNPSNRDFSTLSFHLDNASFINAKLLNSFGQNIKTIFNGKLQSGMNELKIKTNQLSKGIYFLNITIDKQRLVKKLIID